MGYVGIGFCFSLIHICEGLASSVLHFETAWNLLNGSWCGEPPHLIRRTEHGSSGLAKELIEAESGKFEPDKIPDKYAETLRELLQAKVKQRAPQIEVAAEGKAKPEVVNIMAALKQSMESKGRAKVRDVVRRRMGKQEKEELPRPRASKPRSSPRRTAH
jgi:hypothetical protein